MAKTVRTIQETNIAGPKNATTAIISKIIAGKTATWGKPYFVSGIFIRRHDNHMCGNNQGLGILRDSF
jgi:hypothetical protein